MDRTHQSVTAMTPWLADLHAQYNADLPLDAAMTIPSSWHTDVSLAEL